MGDQPSNQLGVPCGLQDKEATWLSPHETRLCNMIGKVKDFVWRQNEQGKLLLVRSLWRCARNAHRFFAGKRLCNFFYYAWLVTVGKYRPLVLGRNIENGIFYICVARGGAEKHVLKIPHLHTKTGWRFYKELRDRRTFKEYQDALLSRTSDPILGPYFPSIDKIRRDGGYRSSYVEGYNLLQVRDAVRRGCPLSSEVQASELTVAIDELLAALKRYQAENGTLFGDWALHNLIYDKDARRIYNVDVEGLYSYEHPALEANLEYVEAVLTHTKEVLQMRDRQAPQDIRILKAVSLVAYATEKDASYSGRIYPMGYHSMTVGGKYFRGQRECSRRLAEVPYDFSGKVVLDLGCNCGGMLHCLAETIRFGVGVDVDKRCINAANLIKFINRAVNLNFFTFDLDRELLGLIKNLLPNDPVDISFLLSVCMWLKNWRAVIRLTASTSRTLLFEANGNELQQSEQVAFVRSCFRKVEVIASESRDDLGQKHRALYLCEAPRA